MNNTFGIGEKQTYLSKKAVAVMGAEMKKRDMIKFVSTPELLRSMINDYLKQKGIICKFTTTELCIALLKATHLRGKVAIGPTKDGLVLVTAYSDELMNQFELLRPLASDFKPHFLQEKKTMGKVLPMTRRAA